MKVSAALAFFDEPVKLLTECVESLVHISDRVVAVDGGYKLVEDARPSSPKSQSDAIKRAAERAGLECEVWAPEKVWEGQVQKRDWLMRQACKGSGWVHPVDADWLLRGDRVAIRARLETTEADALTVPFWTPAPESESERLRLAPHAWHAEMANRTVPIPLIFRALPGFQVDHAHWWMSALRDGKRMALWGHEGHMPPCLTEPLGADLVIEHRCFSREPKQLDRNRVFCRARDDQVRAVGAEA